MHFVSEQWRFTVKIEVCYATNYSQNIIQLELPEGSNIKTAIIISGILNLFPEIDLTRNKIGIFSKIKKLTDILQSGDRVEIYRPLLIDPKEARRARAKR